MKQTCFMFLSFYVLLPLHFLAIFIMIRVCYISSKNKMYNIHNPMLGECIHIFLPWVHIHMFPRLRLGNICICTHGRNICIHSPRIGLFIYHIDPQGSYTKYCLATLHSHLPKIFLAVKPGNIRTR